MGKICRRCSKPIELVKSCGQVDCPTWNPRDIWGKDIKQNLGINEVDKYLVENLCNSCSDRLEDVLTAFYGCKTASEELNTEGGHQGKWWFDTKDQTIKVWEVSKIREFDLGKQNIDGILKSMNF